MGLPTLSEKRLKDISQGAMGKLIGMITKTMWEEYVFESMTTLCCDISAE
jgi:hypothetical protein